MQIFCFYLPWLSLCQQTIDDNDNERISFCNENIPLFTRFFSFIANMLIKQILDAKTHVFRSIIGHLSSVCGAIEQCPNEPCEQIFKQSIEKMYANICFPFSSTSFIRIDSIRRCLSRKSPLNYNFCSKFNRHTHRNSWRRHIICHYFESFGRC